MRKLFKDNVKSIISRFFIVLGVFGFSLCLGSSDPLAASLKPEIQATFGSDSTVAYAIYIAEIVMGGVAYIKTKNLMLLLGVPILVLFTHTMFTYIST